MTESATQTLRASRPRDQTEPAQLAARNYREQGGARPMTVFLWPIDQFEMENGLAR